MHRTWLGSSSLMVVVTLVSSAARAQDTAPPEEDGDRTKLQGQMGGSWSTGNSKSLNGSAAARVSSRFGQNEITFSSALSYGTAQARPKGAPEDAPEQKYESDALFYGRLRYDRFFLEKNSIFLGFLGFRDTSSGFKARWTPYAGYQRTLIHTEAFELWLDVGYRLGREYLELDPRAERERLPPSRWTHGPLLLLGTKFQISETLDADIGAEAQQNVNVRGDFRVFGMASLFNRVGHGFFLGTNLNLRYLRTPIGDREPLDTQLQLVLLFDHEIPSKQKK